MSNIFYCSLHGSEQWTPRYAVEILLPHIEHLKDKVIWLPFDTVDSWFYRILVENGYRVVCSSILTGQDFFEYEPEHWDVILSNPPYKGKVEFIKRADSFGKPWCFFIPVTILSDGVLNRLFGDMSELTMLIPDRRTRFKNQDNPDIKNSQPTFKAAYIGRNFFKRQIIGASIPSNVNLGDFNSSIFN